jgi:hypothetical protein
MNIYDYPADKVKIFNSGKVQVLSLKLIPNFLFSYLRVAIYAFSIVMQSNCRYYIFNNPITNVFATLSDYSLSNTAVLA